LETYSLVDYDNLPGRITRSGLFGIARLVEAVAIGVLGNVDDIHIRLYGGWYDHTGLTQAGTLLTQEMSRVFPLLTSSGSQLARQITCEIASSVIDSPSEIFLFTLRLRRGVRSILRHSLSAQCANPQGCTGSAVAHWSRGWCPAPGCPVGTADVFTYREQKLADTMICVDILALASRVSPPPVFVVSDDDDIAPAVLSAAKKPASIWQLRAGRASGLYDALYLQNGIALVNI
jgi:hypothetical protein